MNIHVASLWLALVVHALQGAIAQRASPADNCILGWRSSAACMALPIDGHGGRSSPLKAVALLALTFRPRVKSTRIAFGRRTSLQLHINKSAQSVTHVGKAEDDDDNDLGTLRDDDDWMFFDRGDLHVEAGGGGDGCVSFRKRRGQQLGTKPFPLGGNGGNGGSVYLIGDSGLNTLGSYTPRKASRGMHGEGGVKHGSHGKDAYAMVPLGTIVRDEATGDILGQLLMHGEKMLVARGGRGGRGNNAFRRAGDSSPVYAEYGEPGDSRDLFLELKFVADVGLVGTPNAGKSTLLAATTRATPKIASYPFTTVIPNLGTWRSERRNVFSSFIVADIPGLLEGAHKGIGMGASFLRHIERCKLLVHVVDGSSEDPIGDFKAIKRELDLFSPELMTKPSVLVLNKVDMTEVREKQEDLLEQLSAVAGHKRIMAISAATHENCDNLMFKLSELLTSPTLRDRPTIPIKPIFKLNVKTSKKDLSCNVEQVATGVWRIKGDSIEKAAVSTLTHYAESENRFCRVMVAHGAFEKLQEAGAQIGDTIMIAHREIQYFNTSSAMAARAFLAGYRD